MEKDKKEIQAEARKKLDGQLGYLIIFHFAYISFLAVVYIFKGHYTETTIKNINKLNFEIQDLEYEYKAISSELMFQNKHGEVVKRVASMGLKEFPYPPMRLKKSEKQENK